jgi:hypothetical protein
VPLGGAATGNVITMHALPGGGVLIGAARGLFRVDPASRAVVAVGGAATGGVFELLDLPGGEVLIVAERGMFRVDPASRAVVAVGGAATGSVFELLALPDGGVLIGAARGLFRVDPASRTVVTVGGAETGSVLELLDLPGGEVLVGSRGGLFFVPALPLSAAVAELLGDPRKWVPETDPKGARNVQFRFMHPCAPVADLLDLRLSVFRAGNSEAERQTPRARSGPNTPVEPGAVILEASARFDKPGDWTLQLTQGTTLIGEPIKFQLAGPTILDRLATAWRWVLAVLGAAYAAFFVSLLWLAHRSAAALRMLLDPAWGPKLLTWPFFLLRHFPAVQRYIFEPWFQNVRRAMPGTEPAFLDPPVAGPQGGTRGASELIGELAARRRLWLQGPTGMGKSAVFAAWERSYFKDYPTLAAAADRYGFILVMLPVRHYAAIDPPEAKAPESWVVECVRRRMEQFGIDVHDATTLRAMLRAGHIAIALDGTNEADRNEAIAAFARQYPMVKLIATSQSDPSEAWDTWRLPATISALRAALLRLWLGDEGGAALEQRLASDGSAAIVSGYDLRLVADLARDDPGSTPLPRGSVELYRAVLARSVRGDGVALDLWPLRQLALKMLVAGRREFSIEEGLQLGEGVAAALSRDGVRVIRRVGKAWEFRHDQMRAFLAASSLAEDAPTVAQLIARVTEQKAFGLRRSEQDLLWGFVAELLRDEDVATLWVYAQEDPGERALLQAALQRVADRRKIRLVRPEATDPSATPSS